MQRCRSFALALLLIVPLAGACSDDPELIGIDGSGSTFLGPSVTETAPSTAPPTSAPEIDVAALTESWGCGYAFNQANPEQTMAVELWYQGDLGNPLVDTIPPVEIVLPDDAWSATIVTGTDLFANHCDDVIESGEPTPVVDEEWELTSGTLTVTDAGSPSCGGPPVHAELTDATFANPDGAEVTIESLPMENSSWGCFAG